MDATEPRNTGPAQIVLRRLRAMPCVALSAPLLMLAACAEPGEPDAEPEPIETALPADAETPTATAAPPTLPGNEQEPDDPCGAQAVAPYIGQEATVPVRRAAAEAAGASTDRWIYPDSMVTQDHVATRLNVVMERDTEIILSASCG